MSEVGLTDLSKLLHTKRDYNHAIVASRKRKLRELFAVASAADGPAHDGFTNPDAPPTTQAEGHFLQANEIFQGKKLNEQTLPSRQNLTVETLWRSLASLGYTHALPSNSKLAPSSDPRRTASPQTTGHQTKPRDTKADPTRHSPSTTTATAQYPSTAVHTTVRSTPAPVARPIPATIAAPRSASPAQLPHPEKRTSTASGEAGVVSKPVQPDPKPTQSTTAQATREAPRVTFSPSTAPPSEGTTNGHATVSKEEGKPIVHDPKQESNAPESKPLPETSKASDAHSSPASTVPSAATPAIHDASTDTSPENEGAVYRDVAEETKDTLVSAGQELKDDAAGSSVIDHGAPDVVESAEDQLLQESLQTSTVAAAAATPAARIVAASGQSLEPLEPKKKVSEETTHAKPATSRTAPNKPAEIPDSRDGTPDKMEIDLPNVPPPVQSGQVPEQAIDSHRPSTPVTLKSTQADSAHQAQRAVTRVSSGAIRPRSVNEIVGGHSRSNSNADKTLSSKEQDQLTPLTSTSHSPTARSQRITPGRKERSKGQVSAVLFGKQPKKLDERSLSASGTPKETFHPSDDYYTPLFIQGFARSSAWMQPLEKVLFHANKTVGTSDASLAIQDHQACKVLHRVYHLQSNDKWSLRQPKRCPEPTRPPSHWDVLLKEVKWMRTDFREERKWKRAIARNLAQACADWCAAPSDERKAMQVPAMIPPKANIDSTVETNMADDAATDEPENEPTPELISGDAASPQNVDDLSDVFPETVSPSAIFTLQEDDVVFGLRRTAAADKLLDELPIYGPPLKVPRVDMIAPGYDPDAHWRRPALPLSKYVEGQMQLMDDGPPRKRSRYNYRNEDSDDDSEIGFVNDVSANRVNLPPSTDEVSLFRPEMKPIRDRLHAGHQFRPPTDHPMPHQNFYECRNPSMWTVAEDDELRSLVREYSYNWPLISNMLTTRSLFASGAERRTPWECFERWINLEGLPSDMQKTQYFKAYNARIEAAQRVIMHNQMAAAQPASQQQQQQISTAGAAGAAGAAGPSTGPATGAAAGAGPAQPIRRRPTTPLRVERRRNQKHLTLLDAMRKLAKKREATIQKQQQTAAQSAANKKPNEAPTQRPNKTPREYSLLRWERDQALAEKMAAFAQRQDATRRAAIMQARSQGQTAQGQNATAASGAQPGQPSQPNMAASNAGPRPNQQAAANAARQAQARMAAQASNGMAANGAQMGNNAMAAAQMNGVAQQGQMQAMQGQQRMAMQGQQQQQQQPDAAMMMRAQRISEQQRQAVQQQQAGHHQVQGQHQQVQHQQQQSAQHQQLLQQAQKHQQQAQQQQAQHQAQQQQGGSGTPRPVSQHNSPPPNMANGVNGAGMNSMNGVNGVNHQNFVNNNQAVMNSFNNANANTGGTTHTSPPTNMYMTAASPGSRLPLQIPSAFQSHIAQIEAQVRAKNPNIKPEAARQVAMDHLARAMLAQRQNAMTAAAGGAGQPHQQQQAQQQAQAQQQHHQPTQQTQPQTQQQTQQHTQQHAQQQHTQPQHGLANNIGTTTSPHQYAALLRQQQQQQQQQAATQSSSSPGQQSAHNRQSSEGVTPGTATT